MFDMMTARRIAENIHIPSDFGLDGESNEIFEFGNFTFDLKDFGDFRVDNGISKAVIIFDDLPFVVKVPLRGTYYREEFYNEEADEYEYSDEYNFNEYRGACDYDYSDYCFDELQKTQLVIEAGFGKIVPEMEWVCFKDGSSVYVQEKVLPFSTGKNKYSNPTADSVQKAKDMDDKYGYCALDWRASVIDFYGEDFWKSFVDWERDNDYDILSDMHSGNYGYRLDGTPVIFDIAGYRD